MGACEDTTAHGLMLRALLMRPTALAPRASPTTDTSLRMGATGPSLPLRSWRRSVWTRDVPWSP
jgi:hypothetical protein